MSKRPDYLQWKDYFMATALLISKRSKDTSTQVGACIVDKANRILAVGYNGFPRQFEDDTFPWGKDQSDPYNVRDMYVVHAEANAIVLNENATNVSGATLYTTHFPCNECTKLIIQSGIKEVIYISDKFGSEPSYQGSKRMLDTAGVTYRPFVPSQSTLTLDFNA